MVPGGDLTREDLGQQAGIQLPRYKTFEDTWAFLGERSKVKSLRLFEEIGVPLHFSKDFEATLRGKPSRKSESSLQIRSDHVCTGQGG